MIYKKLDFQKQYNYCNIEESIKNVICIGIISQVVTLYHVLYVGTYLVLQVNPHRYMRRNEIFSMEKNVMSNNYYIIFTFGQ